MLLVWLYHQHKRRWFQGDDDDDGLVWYRKMVDVAFPDSGISHVCVGGIDDNPQVLQTTFKCGKHANLEVFLDVQDNEKVTMIVGTPLG